MASWNVSRLNFTDYRLHNGPMGDRTRLTCSPKSDPDVRWLMKRMRALKVPVQYTFGLNEIYFTRMSEDGDYYKSRLRICVHHRSWVTADRTLVHELAHHLEDVVGASKDPELAKEKETSVQHMPDGYARKSISEYLACGFEVYYCGDSKQRQKMKLKNPILFNTIRRLHRRFSRL